jgi:hypothetical protein
MPGLFISYRRDDAAADAGRLFDRLKLCCRTDVYLDITTKPGHNFREVLAAKLEACDVVLVLIGPRWLTAQDPKTGLRRLDDPADFVRFEIATALQKGKTIIPVLLPGGKVPRKEELPEDIQELIWCEAADIRYEHWHDDVNTLISQLPRSLGCAQERRAELTGKSWLTAAIVPVVLITAVHIFAVSKVEYPPPEAFYIGFSIAFGSLHAFQYRFAVHTWVSMAAAIAIGVGILTSTIVPLIYNQDIIPRSMVPVRQFVLLVAGILGGYLAGGLPADALLRRRLRGS